MYLEYTTYKDNKIKVRNTNQDKSNLQSDKLEWVIKIKDHT